MQKSVPPSGRSCKAASPGTRSRSRPASTSTHRTSSSPTICPTASARSTTSRTTSPGRHADCDPGAGFAPTERDDRPTSSRTPTGRSTSRSRRSRLDANGSTQVSFSARMRAVYTGGVQRRAADVGRTTRSPTRPPDGDDHPGARRQPARTHRSGDRHDDSSVTHRRPTGRRSTRRSCPNVDADGLRDVGDGYVDDPTPADDTFAEGDRVCFQIRVNFPTNVSTRNPVVADFLPSASTYEAGIAVATAANNTSRSTVDARRATRCPGYSATPRPAGRTSSSLGGVRGALLRAS